MNLLERIRNDRIAILSCIALGGSLTAKLVQAFILHTMTDLGGAILGGKSCSCIADSGTRGIFLLLSSDVFDCA